MSGAVRAPENIRVMFDDISGRYDLMNHLMTGWRDQRWRALAARLAVGGGASLALDAATGTGGLARALRQAGAGRVIGIDLSASMLDLAALRSRSDDGIRYRYADVTDLPFDDGAFDACTIGFGLRNVSDFQAGIDEMVRVLSPGGRLVILEMTPVQRRYFGKAFDIYLGRLIPVVGWIVTGERDAYRYLSESAKAFSKADRLAQMMSAAGLAGVRWRFLAAGSVALHVGTKAERGQDE
ncbi:MAG: ubiquinone/menaquinone biosynthesis methyltransferase [Thermomicrobiales bacterium]